MLAWVDVDGVSVEGADGHARRLLVPASSGCTVNCAPLHFAWSPDGERLAVSGAGKMTNRLLDVSARTGRSVDLAPTRPFTTYYILGWSPDGSSVIYTRSGGNPGTSSCCRLDLVVASRSRGSARTVFAFEPGYHGSSPSLSPNGRSIAFQIDDPSQGPGAVVDLRSGRAQAIHALHGLQVVDAPPTWSPDSRRIALANANGHVITIASAGGGIRVLGPAGTVVAWARNGEVDIVRGTHLNQVVESSARKASTRLLFRAPANLEIVTIDQK